MDINEYQYALSMQRHKKQPLSIVLERFFISKEHYRFCFNALIGLLMCALPAIMLIESFFSMLKEGNVIIEEYHCVRFALSFGFLSLSMIIIYLSYCLLIFINTMMMANNIYYWTFGVFGRITQLSISVVLILKMAIKVNLLYHLLIQEHNEKRLAYTLIGRRIDVVKAFEYLVENSDSFSSGIQAVLAYFQYALIAALIWIIFFKSKNPVIRGLIVIFQIGISAYIRESTFIHQDMNKLLIVNRLCMLCELLLLIYNIKWLYEKYKGRDLMKITVKDCLIHLNSLLLILGWLLCIFSSLQIEITSQERTPMDQASMRALIWSNLPYCLYGIELVLLGSVVFIGKTLSELVLYPINKEFFCYTSDKYRAFVRVVSIDHYSVPK